jgi:hypothetical protein
MYKKIRNLEWVDAEHTRIKCEVDFNHVDFEEWTPFCADPTDTFAPYSKEIFDKAAAGEFGEVKEYVAPPPIEFIQPMRVVDVTSSTQIAKDPSKLELEIATLKEQMAILLSKQ